jgi:hypothetical protein
MDLIATVLIASFLPTHSLTSSNTDLTPFYVRVKFYSSTTAEAKLLIDEVKDYTNLFVLY